MLFHCVVAVSGDISYEPKSQWVFVGGKATLYCASNATTNPPDWKLTRKSSGKSEWIVLGGKVVPKYADKYTLPAYRPRPEPQFQSDARTHQLVVNDLTMDDAGEYTCYEDQRKTGNSASANVTVMNRPKGIENLHTTV